MRKKEQERCRNDPVYFVETYGHIEDKDAAELIQPFQLWDGQRKALKTFARERRVVVLKARQLGFTWLALHEGARLIALQTGRTVVGLSRTEEEAKELIRRMKVILQNMPELIAESPPPPGWSGPWFEPTTMKVVVHWPDGPDSVFQAFASTPAAARSFTADLIIIDEWAFQPYAEEIWQSAFPVINRPFGGRVIGLSTIKLGTLFEEIVTNPGNGFYKLFLPWNTDPRRDAAWYAATVASLGEAKTRQEYPATVEEALEAPAGRFFSELGESHRSVTGPGNNVRRYCAIDYGLDMLSAIWFGIDDAGHCIAYHEVNESNLNIPQACERILGENEPVDQFLGPSDLWSRSAESGKCRADMFQKFGVNMVKVSRDFPAGCAAMKEWLSVDSKTGTPFMTFWNVPELWRCLSKIQVDEKDVNVYAKTPHSLTHAPDAMRYFCTWWTSPARKEQKANRRRWTADMLEDYKNAGASGRRYLREKWGDPA